MTLATLKLAGETTAEDILKTLYLLDQPGGAGVNFGRREGARGPPNFSAEAVRRYQMSMSESERIRRMQEQATSYVSRSKCVDSSLWTFQNQMKASKSVVAPQTVEGKVVRPTGDGSSNCCATVTYRGRGTNMDQSALIAAAAGCAICSDVPVGATAESAAGIYVPTCCNDQQAQPTYTTFYVEFTTTGTTTWTAPATIQSPITYWIVGGGGGGAGAYDQRGNGGGGGGAAITGTYAVVAGTTYDIVVGAGGAGGTGKGSPSGSHTDGADGTGSSFDFAGGGPVAAGGGKGLIGAPFNQGGIGGTVTGGGGGGGGGGNGGGGGGAGGNGTNGAASGFGPAGTGGTGVSFTIPGYNGGNPQAYGAGGNGGANRSSGFAVGASGSANRGNGGGGGSAYSSQPPSGGGFIQMGGNGGSGLVVIQYSA